MTTNTPYEMEMNARERVRWVERQAELHRSLVEDEARRRPEPPAAQVVRRKPAPR